jgi:hypothetical protein
MSQSIPWSAEAEKSLIWKIRSLALAGWGFIIATIAVVIFMRDWPIAGVLIVGAWLCFSQANTDREKLGWEEFIDRGVRFAGKGMLANKPRDTSRLTKWNRIRYAEFVQVKGRSQLGFICKCERPILLDDMKWIPNVPEDSPSLAVDPQGGRYVKHCACGIAHYMVRENAAI